MNLNDITNESINEFLTKRSRAVRRGAKQGKEKLKQVTNALSQDLAQFLGVKGKKISTADTNDIVQFLNTKGLDTSDIDTDLPMDKKRIYNILNAKAQDKILNPKATAPKKNSSSDVEFKSKRKKKLKLPADVVSTVSKLSDQQKVDLANEILKKYGS